MNGPYSRNNDHGLGSEDQNYRSRTPTSRPRTPSGRDYVEQFDPRSRHNEQKFRHDGDLYNPRRDYPGSRDYPDLDTSREAHSVHGYDIPSDRYGSEFRKDIDKWASSSFRYPNERQEHLDRRLVRSRTPGPEMMRSGGSESFRDDLVTNRSRTPNPHEMRSKTPTHEIGYSVTSPLPQSISGTPAFIPASQYNKKSSYEGDNNRYQDNPYRTPYDDPLDPKYRPISRPDYSSSYRDNMNINSKLNTSATYSDSLSFNSDRAKDNLDSYGGRVPPEHPEIPPVKHPRKLSTSFEHEIPIPSDLTKIPRVDRRLNPLEETDYDQRLSPGRLPYDEGRYVEMNVFLRRQESGFGFRIIGGTEEGSQVITRLSDIIYSCNSLLICDAWFINNLNSKAKTN